MTSGTSGGHNYTSTPPAYIYKSSTDYYVQWKAAASWGNINGTISPYTIAASRDHPCGFFLEYHKNTTDGTWRLTNGVWRGLNFTKDKFLSVLKYPDPLVTPIAGMNAATFSSIANGDHTLFPHIYLVPTGQEAYIEAFSRYPDNSMEVMDIGYCLIP
jgi:hypothetical protein